jgi:hypothetical protein
MSLSVTGERSFGLFRLNAFEKAMKSKAENAISGRYGSMKKNMYLCGIQKEGRTFLYGYRSQIKKKSCYEMAMHLGC